MQAKQFDQWTRQFGGQLTRRTAIVGLLALATASVPRAISAQSGTPTAVQDDDDQSDADVVSRGLCADIVWCKASQMNMRDSTVTTLAIGRIPGGPYETEWCARCFQLTDTTWLPGCWPIGHDLHDLNALCNSTFPADCQNNCCAGATIDFYC